MDRYLLKRLAVSVVVVTCGMVGLSDAQAQILKASQTLSRLEPPSSRRKREFAAECRRARELLAAGKAAEAIDTFRQLDNQWKWELIQLRQRLSGIGQGQPLTIAMEAEGYALAGNAVASRLAIANIQSLAGHCEQGRWIEAYRKELGSGGISERSLEIVCDAMAGDLGKDRLMALFHANVSPMANAILAQCLLQNHSPGGTATKEELATFYEKLIVGTTAVPAVCDSLLVRYIAGLDRVGASSYANAFLDQFVPIVPDSDVAVRAVALRLAGTASAERDARLENWWSEYRGQRLGRAIRTAYANRLARGGRFIDALAVLDVKQRMQKTSSGTLVQDLVDVCCAAPDYAPYNALPDNADPADMNRALTTALEASSFLHSYFTGQCRSGKAADGAKTLSEEWLPGNAICLGAAAELAGQKSLLAQAGAAEVESLNRKELEQRVSDTLAKGDMAAMQSRLAVLQPSAAQHHPLAAFDGADLHARLAIKYAAILGREGKADQAIKLLGRVTSLPNVDHELLSIAYAMTIELLLDQPDAELKLDVARQYLGGMAKAVGDKDPCLQDLQLRLALRQMIAAKPNDRPAVWQEAQKTLACDSQWSQATLVDLKKLESSCAPGDKLYQQVLADLMAGIPSGASMLQLQRLRIEEISGSNDWKAFRPAVELALAMSASQACGPFETLSQVEEQARAAKAPADELSWLVGLRQGLIDSSQTPLWKGTPADPGLADAAARRLQMGTPQSHRAQAYLKLFEGKKEEAIGSIADMLAMAPSSADMISDAIGDIEVIICACDGRLLAGTVLDKAASGLSGNAGVYDVSGESALALLGQKLGATFVAGSQTELQSTVFCKQPPSQRQLLLQTAADRIGERQVRWGIAALARHAGDESVYCAAAGLSSRPSERAADQLFTEVAMQATPEDIAGSMQWLETVANKVGMDSAVGQRLQYRFVMLRREGQASLSSLKSRFDAGEYEDCLKAIDELDQKFPVPGANGDFPVELLRATTLAKLGRDEEALKLLGQMHAWSGSPEDMVQCLLLTGIIRMRGDDRAAATSALEEVVQRYPGSAAAAQAKELLKTLE